MYPNPLKKGDRVALITPSSPIAKDENVEFAIGYFKKLGFEPVEGANCRRQYGHLAGFDSERAADFNWAFGDDSIKGVFCIRGGNGAAKILDRVDFGAVAKNPKLFCGYSDISALHAAIHQKTGLITYHTPLAGDESFTVADGYTLAQFEKYILNPNAKGAIEKPPGHSWEFLVEGKAEGPLCGGNLSCLSALMGTPYELDTEGKIFFIEEVGEKPPRIDRKLNAFKMAGKFDGCVGVIFGGFTNCKIDNPASSLDILTIVKNLELKVPVVWGFPCGHSLPTASLPLGANARLDSANSSIELI